MTCMLAAAWPWEVEVVVRLAVASLLGALIGLERERHGRSAGFRTQLLVALGSALAMIVSIQFGRVYGESASPAIQVDPARVAYGVMGGIGFLGAGAILRYRVGIRGLTTAASLWCNAAVGLACGFGMYLPAIAAAIIVVFTLLVLSKLQPFLPAQWYKTLTVTLPLDGQDNIELLKRAVAGKGGRVLDISCHRQPKERLETISLVVVMPTREKAGEMLELARDLPQITKISLE